MAWRERGDIFRKAEAAAQRVLYSLFTLSGSVCPTQPRPRNPPPLARPTPLPSSLSPRVAAPAPERRRFCLRQHGCEGLLVIFHRPNRGPGGGRLELDEVGRKFRFERVRSRIWRGGGEGGERERGSVLVEISILWIEGRVKARCTFVEDVSS